MILLLNQFKSTIILILIFAAVRSIFLQDAADAIIILTFVIIISGLLGFWEERGASNATERSFALVQVKANVLKDSQSQEITNEEVVPGDIVVLCAGKKALHI